MKCKEVPDIPILRFLAGLNGQWGNWYFGNERDVHKAMPSGIPDNVVHAKMRRLIARGLVDGCDCGCRGDFEITDKGREYLRACSSLEEHRPGNGEEGGAFDSAQAH